MAEKHFFEQRKHAKTYLVPFLERYCPNFRRFQILDVGCAEAGFLGTLQDAHMPCMGLEIEAERIAISKGFNPDLDILQGDITDPDIVSKIKRTFDLIVIRDVIEHISDKDTVFEHLNALLNSDGFIYITFPPRFSPFGGHQQNGRSILRKIPYLHLMPSRIVRALGRIAGEHPHIVESIVTQRHIGLSIRQFERLSAKHGYRIHRKDLFLFRPVFQVRYGLPTKRMPDIPAVREFFVLGCECLLQKAPAPAAL
jgi:SAM-dependent methyltransferase